MAFVHGETALRAGSKDAWCESLSEGCDVGFIGGGEVDEAGEVRCDSVESSDVVES